MKSQFDTNQQEPDLRTRPVIDRLITAQFNTIGDIQYSKIDI